MLTVMQGFNENQKFSADQPSLTHGGTARLPFHNTFVSFLLCFSPLLSLLSNPKGPSKVQFGLTYNSDVATEALHSLKFKNFLFFFLTEVRQVRTGTLATQRFLEVFFKML